MTAGRPAGQARAETESAVQRSPRRWLSGGDSRSGSWPGRGRKRPAKAAIPRAATTGMCGFGAVSGCHPRRGLLGA